MNLKDFLATYGDVLIEHVKNIKPLYSPPENPEVEDSKFENLLRKPFPKQRDAILSLAEGFKQGRNALFLTAEMGTGKTMMAICTAYIALPGRSRTVVLCPSHLVQKWIREIQMTIPHARVYDIGGWSVSDLLALRETTALGREFYIVGREKAKLSYIKKFSSWWNQPRLKRLICPKCGREDNQKKSRLYCSNCGEALWQADNQKTRRVAVAEIIKRYFPRGFFDLFIADEVHQYKSGDSAQGNAFAFLASRSKRTLCLTGTLMGGYASNLFYLLWRLIPGEMIKKFPALRKMTMAGREKFFIHRYGVVERIVKRSVRRGEGELGVASIAKKNGTRTVEKEKPGISPVIFTDLLLERSVFLRLSDVSSSLPAYEEFVVNVPMDPVQAEEYEKLERNLKEAVKNALKSNSTRLLGAMLQSLLAYPDGTRKGEVVIDVANDQVIAEAAPLDISPLPKEEKLVELVQSEIAQGRKCLIYLEHTGTRDLIPDLEKILREDGVRVASLKSTTVSVGEREAWINKLVDEEDIDVLICNPRLVETGLDLVAFPTVIFFQTGYSLFTLRQASRRSWRIGQTQPVKVYYLTYENTIQEKALALMANKMQVALMVEGELSDKGLTALADGETSIIVELAKSLVENTSLTLKDEWRQYKLAQLKMDAVLGGRKQKIEERMTVILTDGERKETVHFTQVLRGYVIPKSGGYATAVVDGKHVFVFKGGDILYGKRKVGWYRKDGTGEIGGKPIRLVKAQGNKWALYELRNAA